MMDWCRMCCCVGGGAGGRGETLETMETLEALHDTQHNRFLPLITADLLSKHAMDGLCYVRVCVCVCAPLAYG
jgi:hypothetical protein